MKVIKIAICDDEKCFIDTIEKMLKVYEKKNEQDFIIKKYTKPLQLMESLKEEFQIFFLDIEMPAMDGMMKSQLFFLCLRIMNSWELVISMTCKILLRSRLHKSK